MPAMTDDATIAVSVVVPASGRMDLLDRCLDALVRQQVNPHSYEIIVVDDEPNHNTLHLVAGWRTRTLDRGPRLSYIANPGPNGPAAARNRGWRNARASIVAFTSDEAVPESGWLAAGIAALRDNTEVVCGRIRALVPPRPTDGQRSVREHEAADFTSASCFFRKPVLERLGGFDERFNVPRGTDADMYFRLLEHGIAIGQAPAALVLYPLGPAPWGASLLQVRHAEFDALLYKKHPALYRQKVEPRPAWDNYVVAGVLLLALASALLGMAVMAALAFGAWLLLTARRCAHSLRGAPHTPSHVAEMIVTSALLPPLSVFWRLAGAVRYRVRFA